jgi:hypothetical protein
VWLTQIWKSRHTFPLIIALRFVVQTILIPVVDVIYSPVGSTKCNSLPMVFDQLITHTNPSNPTPVLSNYGENHPQDRGIVCGYQLLLSRVLSSKDTSSTSPELKSISHILTVCKGLLQSPESPGAHGTGSSSAIRERHVGSRRLNSNKVTRAC